MKTNMTLIVAVGFAICSCSNGRDSGSSDEISGAYAREYSFKVVNPETGIEIGMRTIRDTIFIRSVESGYEVSNNKWKLNDYDKEGWQSMEHTENRSMPPYLSVFDRADNSLNNDDAPQLYLNFKEGNLYKIKKNNETYRKVN